MQGKRTDRVGHLIQMELGKLVTSRIKDPRLGFVTVTHVDVTPDLKSACVFYSVLGNRETKDNSQKALEKAAGFLQREIGSVLHLRNTPRLVFKLDESLEEGMKIDSILREIQQKESSGESKPDEE